MRSLLLVLISFLFVNVAQAQFGVSARYSKNSVKDWSQLYQSFSNDNQDLFGSGLEVGINYWFRLKNYRVEFLPEISYSKSETSNLSELVFADSHNMTSYNFNLNVQIYPLDFEGDCDCPTWSKDGNLVKKGFYWLISPGVSRHNLTTTFDENILREDESSDITTFKMGAGLGLDIGVGDLLTVSPFAIYNLHFGSSWIPQEGTYAEVDIVTDNDSSFNQLQFGLRLIFRPDYQN